VQEKDVEVLERLGENTRACVGMYNTRACLADCMYSYFPHLANTCLHLFLHEANLHWTWVYCIMIFVSFVHAKIFCHD
jgi:hypothetical protein